MPIDLVGVAAKLFEFIDIFEKSGAKKRESIAKYFSRVSESLKVVAKQLKAGELPHGEVAELRFLAEELPSAIGEEVGKEKAIELSELLKKSIGESLENLKSNEEAIKLVLESAGKFDGLAFRIGYVEPKASFIKSTMVILVPLVSIGLVTGLGSIYKPELVPAPLKNIFPFLRSVPDPSTSINPSLSPTSDMILGKLKEVNIGFSVLKQPLLEWLDGSDHRYLNISKGCLNILQKQRLKGEGAFLDVIFNEYWKISGIKDNELPQNPQIDQEILKEAIKKAYNQRNSTAYLSFEEIVVTK